MQVRSHLSKYLTLEIQDFSLAKCVRVIKTFYGTFGQILCVKFLVVGVGGWLHIGQ